MGGLTEQMSCANPGLFYAVLKIHLKILLREFSIGDALVVLTNIFHTV